MTTLRILNEAINDIMKIAKSLEESALLIKRVSKTINLIPGWPFLSYLKAGGLFIPRY